MFCQAQFSGFIGEPNRRGRHWTNSSQNPTKLDMAASLNHPILVGFSLINHPFGGSPMNGPPHMSFFLGAKHPTNVPSNICQRFIPKSWVMWSIQTLTTPRISASIFPWYKTIWNDVTHVLGYISHRIRMYAMIMVCHLPSTKTPVMLSHQSTIHTWILWVLPSPVFQPLYFHDIYIYNYINGMMLSMSWDIYYQALYFTTIYQALESSWDPWRSPRKWTVKDGCSSPRCTRGKRRSMAKP